MADPPRRARRGLTVLALALLRRGCRRSPRRATERRGAARLRHHSRADGHPRSAAFLRPRVGELERGAVTVRPARPAARARETGPLVQRTELRGDRAGQAFAPEDEVVIFVRGLDVSF
ncbi:MAG: hypothetical protein R3B82_04365 [Sandaracinaceae bacterium]